MSLVYLHTLTSKVSCRLYLERVVTGSGCEFDIILSKHAQRHGRFDGWYWYSLSWPNVYTQIALHITPYHTTSCCITSFDLSIYIYRYCDSHRIIYENFAVSWYLDTTLCFWSLQWLPCPRMVWPEAPGETGPTTQHLLCAPSRMNSACRRPWVSGIPQVSRPTEAWKTSSDVVLPRSSMVAFRCWPPWDTSPQWLGFAEAAFKIVSVQDVFVNVSISAITLDNCRIYWKFVSEYILTKLSPGNHWQIPRLLISVRRSEVRRCA